MGGPYNIPRNYKGESKILFIFSKKSFIYTAVAGFIGIILFYLFSFLKLTVVGVICIVHLKSQMFQLLNLQRMLEGKQLMM